MPRTHRRITYANVVSTLALFLALGGGAAFAAAQLGKESVGTRELEKNAVTAGKIKAEAVHSQDIADGAVRAGKVGEGTIGTAELADGAVTTPKLADGSVTPAKLAAPEASGASVVHRVRGTATVEFPAVSKTATPPAPYPLEGATFTQPAGEDDIYVASLQVHVPPTCTIPRDARARLFLDKGQQSGNELVGEADLRDSSSAGEKTFVVEFAPLGLARITTAAPDVATSHTFSLELVEATCGGLAAPSGITATGAKIDVIGIR
jgi:hypothetical protein